MNKAKLYKVIPALLLGTLLTSCGEKVNPASGSGQGQESVSISQNVIKDDPYSFDRWERPHPKVDPVITIDGELDDAIYDDLIWMSINYVASDLVINVRLVTMISDTGVFVSGKVTDPSIFYNKARSAFNNTGIELYLASPNARSLTQNAYEIDLLAADVIEVRRYETSGFAKVGYTWETGPVYKAKILGGKINTSNCEGYQFETFFPFESLQFDSKPEYINTNFALIRTFDADKDSGRLWYNFGEHNKPGWKWGDPETFWKFNSGGLIGYKVNISTSGQGEVISDYESFTDGTGVKITIKPTKGNYVKAITINDEDYTDQLKIDENEEVYLVIQKNETLNVNAVFEALPETTSTLTGTITYNGGAASATILSDLKVKYVFGGVIFNGAVKTNSSYQINNLPKGKGTLIVSSYEGYEVCRQEVNITDSSASFAISFTDDEYGIYRLIKADDFNVTNSNVNILDTTNYFATMSSYCSVRFHIKANTSLFWDEANDKPNHEITNGQHPNNFTCISLFMALNARTEAGTKGDKANNDTIFQLVHWNNSWGYKTWLDNTDAATSLDNSEIKKMVTDGLDIVFDHRGNEVTIYVVGSDNTLIQKVSKTSAFPAERYISNVYANVDNYLSGVVWEFSNFSIKNREVGTPISI